jgi:hypothetical protein
MKKSAAYVIAATLFAFGIVHAQATKNPKDAAKPLARGKIRITPVELFPGDLKRLKPHLGIEGDACFKFEYDGPRKRFHIVLQVLEEGNPVESEAFWMGPLGDRKSGEVSVSVKAARDAQGLATWHITTHHVVQLEGVSRVETRRTSRTLPAELSGGSSDGINKVTDFDVNDEVGLWCKVDVRMGRLIRPVPVNEMANDADFAVVLKLVPGGVEEYDDLEKPDQK